MYERAGLVRVMKNVRLIGLYAASKSGVELLRDALQALQIAVLGN